MRLQERWKKMLEVKNLSVEINGKKILKDINIKLEKGKIYFLSGKNGSGKTTLANILMGNPKYKSSGKIFLDNEDITKLAVDERARKGMLMAFQFPNEIHGVNFFNFLRTSYNSLNKKKLSFLEFQNFLAKKARFLGIDEKNFFERNINENFSGGEKKKAEILQMLVLNPGIAIIDEFDSGLDSDSLEKISLKISEFSSPDKTILIITHNKNLSNYITPDKIIEMKDGRISKF